MDLGSNLIRIAVGEEREGAPPDVLRKQVGVARIAAGLGSRQDLDDASIGRAGDVVTELLDVARRFEAPIAKAVATGALRLARNREQVVDALEARTGVRFEVIDGEREAALSALGVRAQVGDVDATVIDIGGTTTEVLVPARDGRAGFAGSVDVGVITLTEWGPDDGPGRDAALRSRADAAFGAAPLPAAVPRPCFVAGGAAVALKTFRDGGSFLDFVGDGTDAMSRDERARIYRRFAATPPDRRAARLGISQDHAGLVPAGYAILEALCRRLEVDEVIPTGRGVVEGLLSEHLGPPGRVAGSD